MWKPFALGVVLSFATAVGSAGAADPFDAVVPPAAGAAACFQARYDAAHLAAHRGQHTTAMALSLSRERDGEPDFAMRLAMERRERKQPFHVVGYCSHYVEDPLSPPLSAEARRKRETKLICMARGGLGGSAEEGGESELEIAADRGSVMLRADDGLSGWNGWDQSGPSDFVELGGEDLIFRLRPVDRAVCAEMEKRISVE
jgi:hypothetical protein